MSAKLKTVIVDGYYEIRDIASNFLVATLSALGLIPATVANAQEVPGIPVVHRIDVADGTTGNVDVELAYKTRVIDVLVVKTAGNGGSGNTIAVSNGSNAITNNIDMNINDTVVARAGNINDANHEIAAGGTLRVVRTKSSGNAACIVYVHGILVP
jgi:hypothetical protein